MDAIQYLTDQHREIDSLFDQIAAALRTPTRLRLCRKLADLLAVHAAIEERIFYPAAKGAGLEALLRRAFEEHVGTERMAAELVAVRALDAAALSRIAALKERKRRHADVEERGLFLRAHELLTPAQLEQLGRRMAGVADELLGPGVGARERIFARRACA